MNIFCILWEAPHLIWFLAVFILVQLIWKLLRLITGVVGKALSSWLEKLIEAFVQTILPDPEKTGEQLGARAISYFKSEHK